MKRVDLWLLWFFFRLIRTLVMMMVMMIKEHTHNFSLVFFWSIQFLIFLVEAKNIALHWLLSSHHNQIFQPVVKVMNINKLKIISYFIEQLFPIIYLFQLFTNNELQLINYIQIFFSFWVFEDQTILWCLFKNWIFIQVKIN